MAIVKITDLPAATSPVSPSDVAAVVQGGVTKKAAIDQFGFVALGAGATARTIQSKLRDTVNVNDFGAVGDGVADDTVAIQTALNSFTGFFGTVVLASNAKYRITAPLIIRRGRNLVGDGSPEIIADFSAAGWSGDYVALKFVVDSAVTQPQLQEGYGQKSYGFRLSGLNNAGVVSYGMRFYSAITIPVGSAVNYSYIWGTIENVNIRRFDTGIWMQEVWNSYFGNVNITYCRRGLYVEGKSVNVTFVGLQVQNPTNDNTSSAATTRGIQIDSGFHYQSGAEGRPEGLMFIGGLLFGHHYNLHLQRSLKVTFESMIIDGASDHCVVIEGPHYTTIRDCYLFTGGASKSCVYFDGVNDGSNTATTIDSCEVYGGDGSQIGFNFPDVGAARNGITISNNSAFDLDTVIQAVNCPLYSHFINNYAQSHAGTRLIYVQNGGNGTVIDGNTTSTSNVYPVECHPVTNANLKIGTNNSPTYTTRFSGTATITAGNTTVNLPNNMYGAEKYIRAITHATPNGNAGSWYIEEAVSWSTARITIGSALGSNLQVRYTTTCVPYLAI